MLRREHQIELGEVKSLICGHSHDYVPWDGAKSYTWHDGAVAVSNTGGWLCAHGKMEGGIFFCDFNGERVTWSSTVLR